MIKQRRAGRTKEQKARVRVINNYPWYFFPDKEPTKEYFYALYDKEGIPHPLPPGVAIAQYERSWRYKSNMCRTYKITPEQFDIMFEQSEGKCAICKAEKKLVIDHDHSNGKMRGLICNRCNIRLGGIEKNGNSYQKLLDYLSIYQKMLDYLDKYSHVDSS